MPPQTESVREENALTVIKNDDSAPGEKISSFDDGNGAQDDILATNDVLPPRKYVYNWVVISILAYFQFSGLYGLYLAFVSASWKTTVFSVIILQLTLLGVAAGAHRLWSHRSYKAKLLLKIFLAFFQTMAYQETIFMWARNHRLHHKYVDDDADPYNPKRGFFFSHWGWLMVNRHPRSIEKGKQLDLSDLLSDPVIYFQKKYYNISVIILCYIVPVIIPMYFWGESLSCAWHLNSWRWTTALHCALAINSIAHHHGYKPYDKRIGPSNHWTLNVFSVGEGAHNYHHVFPWDYRSVEMNTFYFNLTTFFIEMMAKIGLAYDLKHASDEMVEKRANKTGIKEHRPKKIKFPLT